MREFRDSFNFIIGTANETIDLFNNPYIQFKVVEVTQDGPQYVSDYIKLIDCPQEYIKKFIK